MAEEEEHLLGTGAAAGLGSNGSVEHSASLLRTTATGKFLGCGSRTDCAEPLGLQSIPVLQLLPAAMGWEWQGNAELLVGSEGLLGHEGEVLVCEGSSRECAAS